MLNSLRYHIRKMDFDRDIKLLEKIKSNKTLTMYSILYIR
jgi:hypothetical protein